jgi:hypothetical protein
MDRRVNVAEIMDIREKEPSLYDWFMSKLEPRFHVYGDYMYFICGLFYDSFCCSQYRLCEMSDY